MTGGELALGALLALLAEREIGVQAEGAWERIADWPHCWSGSAPPPRSSGSLARRCWSCPIRHCPCRRP